VAITGATGSVYGLTLVSRLLAGGVPVRLTFTKAARRVVETETGKTADEWAEEFAETSASAQGVALRLPGSDDRFPLFTDHAHPLFALDPIDDVGAPGASGSFRARGMVVAPCSMGTLGRVAAGVSGNLLERQADVCLKERRPLVLLARETPLSTIHLRNMLSLTEAGAIVMPPVPAFYSRPETVEDIVNQTVDRAFDLLGLPAPGAARWGYPAAEPELGEGRR